MTYKELYESAIDKLEKSKITLGEFEKMIEPLNAEIDTDSDTINRAKAIEAVQNRPMMLSKEKVLLINDLEKLPSAQPEQQHGRIFREIVVEYPSYCTYPEYKGKPYFSIKYTENGQEFIGYGTYKPEVLSKYLKEYFMPPARPERIKGHWTVKEGELAFWDVCSVCRKMIIHRAPHYNFCPNCGADMREVTE
jgi:hypothetical protein